MTSLQLMMQLVVFSTIALGTVYFLFYRPTVDAQRRARRVVSDLRVGDEVVTSGGLIGRVVGVSEPDNGPAIVSLDLGTAVVRVRITAINDLMQRAPAAQTATPMQEGSREPTLAPIAGGGLTERHAK